MTRPPSYFLETGVKITPFPKKMITSVPPLITEISAVYHFLILLLTFSPK